jgi:hypothetical protein
MAEWWPIEVFDGRVAAARWEVFRELPSVRAVALAGPVPEAIEEEIFDPSPLPEPAA